MGTSNALFTGLTGLLSNQRRLDVIGNNIANVGTTSFKSSRMLFSTLYAQTSSAGSAPGLSGGTNPMQVGSGAMIAGTQRNFAGGAITPPESPLTWRSTRTLLHRPDERRHALHP